MRPRPAWIDTQIGNRFGSIVILSRQIMESGVSMALIRCDCGIEKLAYPNNIRKGLTKACGNHPGKHRMSTSSEYRIWNQMIRRCTKPTHAEFKNYGGRGITVCGRWMKFENFFADIGPKPARLSLDRFPNNDGNYEPGNCRWATSKEQCNNMRKNVHIEFNGRRQTQAQWAAELGMSQTTIRYRLKRGHAPSIALNPENIQGKRFDLEATYSEPLIPLEKIA